MSTNQEQWKHYHQLCLANHSNSDGDDDEPADPPPDDDEDSESVKEYSEQ